jgi:hypothetical protein
MSNCSGNRRVPASNNGHAGELVRDRTSAIGKNNVNLCFGDHGWKVAVREVRRTKQHAAREAVELQ